MEEKVERVSLDKKGYLRDEKGNVVVTDKVNILLVSNSDTKSELK